MINTLGCDFNASAEYPVIALDTTGRYAVAWLDTGTGYKQI